MAILKQSVGYKRSFSMVLTADHVSPATGKTVTVNLSKAGAAPSGPLGTVTEIGNGFYYIFLQAGDTNTLGDLSYVCTAAACDQTSFTDQIVQHVVSDISLNASGQVIAAGTLRQNVALNSFPFLMTTSGIPKTGLSITAQRSLGGAGFSPCANSPSELSNGIYVINLAASDLNAPTVTLRFTASGADDNDIFLVLQP